MLQTDIDNVILWIQKIFVHDHSNVQLVGLQRSDQVYDCEVG